MKKIFYSLLFFIPVFIFVLLTTKAPAQLIPFQSREAPVQRPDTIIHPFINNLQLIEIDFAAAWQRDVDWHESFHPRAMSWSQLIPPPPPNLYVFRNNKRQVVKAFNSSWTLDELTKRFSNLSSASLIKSANLGSLPFREDASSALQAHYYYRYGFAYRMKGYYLIWSALPADKSFKKQGSKTGMIDSAGNIVFPVIYDYIEQRGPYFLVKKDGLFGIINADSAVILPLEYEKAEASAEDLVVFTKDRKISCLYDVQKQQVVLLNNYDWIDQDRLDVLVENKTSSLVQVRKNGKTGFINRQFVVVVPPVYDYASPVFRDGRLLVCRNNKWGFINQKGKEVIPCELDDAIEFDNGHAMVMKNGRKYCINAEAKESAGCNMQWMNWKIEDYQYIADRRIIKRNGREGVSSNGDRIIVPLIYDNIIAIGINGRSQAFHQQFFKVRRFGKWGVISKDGKEILPCEYDLVDDFKGEVDLIMVGKNDLCGLLDLSFRWVIPCKYEQLNPFSYQGKICFAKNKLWGWMNMDERIIVPPKYDEINWMYDGRMQVVRNKRYGVVDSTGKEIIPLQYQYVHTRFYNGLIMASLNNKWGFIDSVNHIVIPFEYDAARNFEKSITAVVRGKKYGFINRQNVAVTGFKYDFAGHEWSYDNKLLVRKNNLTGYVDETGQEVIPCVYEEEDGFSPALGHHMRKGTTWSYVK